jgi:hypothetical protein
MSGPRHIALLGALACLILGSAGAAAGQTAAGQPFNLTSSVDGKKVLPLRSRWLAYPDLVPAKIAEVDFLIDGKVRSIEHAAPYNYGSDDKHGHLGYLITTWLPAGRHTFTVRAIDKTGRRATDTRTLRVLPAPAPPAAIAGTWTRTLTAADANKATSGQPPPTGAWKIVIDKVGIWALDPMGSGVVDQYAATPTGGLNAYAPIAIAPKGISRFGATGVGCCECREDGPFGSYTWSTAGDTLTLKAKKDPCGDRRAIWEGTWTKEH